MRTIQMVERYGHVEHFCDENLNVHYLFEIVLYIKMKIWHYVMFKCKKIVLIWIVVFNRCIVNIILYSINK